MCDILEIHSEKREVDYQRFNSEDSGSYDRFKTIGDGKRVLYGLEIFREKKVTHVDKFGKLWDV